MRAVQPGTYRITFAKNCAVQITQIDLKAATFIDKETRNTRQHGFGHILRSIARLSLNKF
jgi:hypothetical protein